MAATRPALPLRSPRSTASAITRRSSPWLTKDNDTPEPHPPAGIFRGCPSRVASSGAGGSGALCAVHATIRLPNLIGDRRSKMRLDQPDPHHAQYTLPQGDPPVPRNRLKRCGGHGLRNMSQSHRFPPLRMQRLENGGRAWLLRAGRHHSGQISDHEGMARSGCHRSGKRQLLD